ncbi:metal ABC transporter ATP-binding protein [Paenibacillus pasadenensis]|uniref:Zinc ABC transporter, ATP-binding protein ZnuC n=1 Tax=Paenibacillus pasadenensis TaxID=217090 RepID=A0A2N5N612_9BACL|nr:MULTISPECIES: metal ABC transporter ATP-binding protein [Paenibacillus]PLT45765.1 Zinc ABC transporter, ATP-binding protein ZnuC [Paenibacillus pasadenensis]QGG56199.1 ATP-binding cassette domain-containing protein [Paenibacillus sp. B01]
MILASLKEVEFGYNDAPSLHNATIEVRSREFAAVTGPNGASKTTLLKLMLGLLKPWKGKTFLAGKREDGRPLKVSYVPQQIAAFNGGFPSNVQEFVLSGCLSSGSWLRRVTKEDRELAEKSLRQVGMWQLRERRIGELSGGQKQRICIARALAQRPDLLVMDEPTTGMDEASRKGFYELMRHMVDAHGMSIVMVTHGLEECRPYLDRIIELERKGEGGWKCCTTTLCSGHFSPAR